MHSNIYTESSKSYDNTILNIKSSNESFLTSKCKTCWRGGKGGETVSYFIKDLAVF